jgi:uncharacterized membrane protein
MHGGIVYTGLLATSMISTMNEVVSGLVVMAKEANQCKEGSGHVLKASISKRAARNGHDICLRDTYVKVSRLAESIGKQLGAVLTIQFLYHGLMLVVFTAMVTNVTESLHGVHGSLDGLRNCLIVFVHAGVVFRILRAAQLLTDKVMVLCSYW